MGVSVRHNSRLAALVALAAAVMTVAWFARALQTASLLDWAWCVLVATVGVLQLLVIRDGRAPLMVADEHGVRVRRGQTWSGLRWQDIEHVDVESPGSWLRDGRIIVHPRAAGAEPFVAAEGEAEEVVTAGIHEGGSSTPGDEAYVVPLGRTTRLSHDGMTGDLIADLDALASGQVPVLVLTRLEDPDPVEDGPTEDEAAGDETAPGQAERLEADAEAIEPPEEAADEDVPAAAGSREQERRSLLSRLRRREVRADVGAAGVPVEVPVEVPAGDHTSDPDPEPVLARTEQVDPDLASPVAPAVQPAPAPQFAPVAPGRETRPAARSEVLREPVQRVSVPPAVPAQRGIGSPVVVSRVDDFVVAGPRPAADPLIGPLIAAARNRARLSIDVLSERTRIRPHVLERIEVDDFEACGGDFYARGHLRTLARVFGLDAQQLVDLYDDNYATAEIEARQVFEAELAAGIGGGVRATSSGPRWSVLAACVLALATVWGTARLFNDTPQELVSPAPDVVDAAGLAATADASKAPEMTLAPIEVTAAEGAPQVVVRDRDGRILWAGKLADGQRQQVIGQAPFEVTASNGGAVQVRYLGKPKGTVGDSDQAASRQFG